MEVRVVNGAPVAFQMAVLRDGRLLACVRKTCSRISSRRWDGATGSTSISGTCSWPHRDAMIDLGLPQFLAQVATFLGKLSRK